MKSYAPILCLVVFFFSLSSAIIAQPVVIQPLDSVEQEAAVLPPTNKSKQSAGATKYSTPPKSKPDWKKKIYVGGYLGMTFGTFTNIEISPIVGYNFTKDFNMGIGVIYNYFSQPVPTGPNSSTQISSSNWGGRLNATYTLFNLISLGAEYQLLSVEQIAYNPSTFEIAKENVPVNILLLGGGLRQSLGRNTAIFVMVFYDVLQDPNSPYAFNNGLVWRMGMAAGF